MLLFSIIIHVYNAGNVLERCINSVLYQTVEDFELLLIDDGSTDSSGSICDSFAERDQRVRVFHKKNGGVSSARNVGLDNATGKYIVFVDSDDYLDIHLLSEFSDIDSDLVSIGFTTIPEMEVFSLKDQSELVLIDDNSLVSYLGDYESVFVWAKRYLKSIIETNNIRFNESLNFGEDTLFNHEYILSSKSLTRIAESSYYHCHYEQITLGSKTWKRPLSERIAWRELSFQLFANHKKVQDFFVHQLLFLVEKEIIEISNLTEKSKNKKRLLSGLFSNDFIKKCLVLGSPLL